MDLPLLRLWDIFRERKLPNASLWSSRCKCVRVLVHDRTSRMCGLCVWVGMNISNVLYSWNIKKQGHKTSQITSLKILQHGQEIAWYRSSVMHTLKDDNNYLNNDQINMCRQRAISGGGSIRASRKERNVTKCQVAFHVLMPHGLTYMTWYLSYIK